MRGERGRRERRVGRDKEKGGSLSLPYEGRLCTGMTSGATAGTTSGGTGEDGAKEKAGPASLGVDKRLLSYMSSVTCTEKEVLQGEVREHDSQEQLV